VHHLPFSIVLDFIGKNEATVRKRYEYDATICATDRPGGAYAPFPWDVREEFGCGRAKVHVTFDGVPYDGSVHVVVTERG
jgi:hypothetical protein